MADRMMNADATAAFLARRAARTDPEPRAQVLTEDEAAKLRRGSVDRAARTHRTASRKRDAGRARRCATLNR